jgi:peptidoglycan/xylan/chitin deacetylase (PgdA/CDA1 family)
MRLLAVNFHYVRDNTPSSGIHPVSMAQLLSLTGKLDRNFPVGGQSELLEALESGHEGNLGVVTFDDGLKEQISAARKLQQEGWPAILFVPTAPFLQRKLLDVHKIHQIRTRISDAECASSLRQFFGALLDENSVAAAKVQYPYDDEQARDVKYFLNFVANQEGKARWISATFERLFGCETAAAEALYMDRDDIRWLARNDMLGTHAHSHRPLSQLTDSEIEDEISRSLECLREMTLASPVGISYPYGGTDAVDERVAAASRRHGLKFGFTMWPGVSSAPAPNFDPLLLRRINPNDLDAALAAGCETPQ